MPPILATPTGCRMLHQLPVITVNSMTCDQLEESTAHHFYSISKSLNDHSSSSSQMTAAGKIKTSSSDNLTTNNSASMMSPPCLENLKLPSEIDSSPGQSEDPRVCLLVPSFFFHFSTDLDLSRSAQKKPILHSRSTYMASRCKITSTCHIILKNPSLVLAF